MSDLANADDIVILSKSYSEMQGLLEAVVVGMRINASKTKVMSAHIPDEQRQAVLLDGEAIGGCGQIQVPRLDVRHKQPGQD